ncbi:MAG: hypothetical protein PHZ26_03475 [Candidatus Gracilibacteria bacterium]|nr:hypothetical protein [Candidatus Gracilibacteria bacterium]MDD2908787.1 hypothetical protein [Candidatus Gracilibacteria bacterium]
MGTKQYYTRAEIDKIMFDYILKTSEDLRKEIKSNNKNELNNNLTHV